MLSNFINSCKVVLAKAASAAGTSAITTDAIDMQDFSRCCFVTYIGTANAGNYIKGQQSSDDAAADAYADLTGTKVTAAANGDIVCLDVVRPRERYLKAVVTRGASTAVGAIYAVLYGPQTLPVTQDSTTIAESHASPAEGTA